MNIRSCRSISCAAALSAAALFIGCGDDGGSTADAAPADAEVAGPDAGFNAEACPSSYGPASVSSTFNVPADTVGFDLDGADDPNGNGMIDNNLGEETLRLLINNSLQGSLDDGSLRLLAELRDFGGIGADDGDLTVVLYGGIDDDDPADLADDFNGDETYDFDRAWVGFDDCAPVASIPASYAGGVVTGSKDSTVFFIETLGGFVEFRLAQLSAAIEADTAGVKSQANMPAMFGGVIPSCSLNKAPGNNFGMSAQEELTRLGIQPDVDLDGDGLETVRAEAGDGIISCTDGDGSTVIDGTDCGCDAAIADGYSITFEIQLVGAAINGPAAQ